ncbi:MAG: aminotransferase class IV [Gemmatales bacterium]|nr:aminotransferase class IV [Gemmatales bacterium]MDW8223167.1 aminotransferase class IV [Gemmatales bacterium]
MRAIASVNGQCLPLAEARIPALDRGFLFGDAVYEVIRVYRGKPFLFDEHLVRLRRSLEAIHLPYSDLEGLRRRVLRVIHDYGFQEATIYIQITRGAESSRHHVFPEPAVPLEFFYVEEFHDSLEPWRQHGVKVITHPDLRWKRCDIKSTNLLPNVLAAQAARQAGAYEALLYQADGTLLEGSRTSCFGVLDGKLLTAPATPSILPGITRALVLRLAREQGIAVEERVLRINDLPYVAELFLTGTTSEILPIIQVDDRLVGDGRPGPITQRLQQAYRQLVQAL